MKCAERLRQFGVLAVFSFSLLFSGCVARAPQESSAVVANAPDQAQQRFNEQAETRQRNRNRAPLTNGELGTLMAQPMHQAHLKLWKDLKSFYALQEVAEGIIEPELGRIRRQDVQRLLGQGDPNYPNSNGRILEYAGDRQIPQGEHLLIHFDANDFAEETEWVSE